jgi:hypothetical protein
MTCEDQRKFWEMEEETKNRTDELNGVLLGINGMRNQLRPHLKVQHHETDIVIAEMSCDVVLNGMEEEIGVRHIEFERDL